MSNSLSTPLMSESYLKTPVLLLLFNRSDNASRLIDSLSLARPSTIYVNIDAPRPGNIDDVNEVDICKKLIDQISWDCTIYRQYHQNNLGCKLSVVSAINWFFDHCEEGIILEDDCIPSLSFFVFCSKMLCKYRYDDRVMQISGSNFVHRDISCKSTCYYSSINDIWGWATWKRAWSEFSLDMTELDQFLDQGLLEIYTGNKQIADWLRVYLMSAKSPSCSTWSSQWTYAMVKNFAFTLVPPINLVRNIGFIGQRGSTHATFPTFEAYSLFIAEDTNCFDTPQFFSPNRQLDRIRFALIKRTDPIFSYRSRLYQLAKRFLPVSVWSFFLFLKRL